MAVMFLVMFNLCALSTQHTSRSADSHKMDLSTFLDGVWATHSRSLFNLLMCKVWCPLCLDWRPWLKLQQLPSSCHYCTTVNLLGFFVWNKYLSCVSSFLFVMYCVLLSLNLHCIVIQYNWVVIEMEIITTA